MFQDLLKNIQRKISDYNQQQPSVIGNILSGKQWNSNVFGNNLISPIPQREFNDNNNQALQYYYNREQRNASDASKYPSTWTPQTVKYPDWMANAPKPTNPVVKPGLSGKATNLPVTPQVKQSKPVPAGGFLENNVFPITDQAGLPRQLVASQWAVESGRSTNSPINNYFGIGPNIPYPSVQSNVNDYVLTLKNILASKGKDIKGLNALQILQALQQGTKRYEGHNPNPQTYINTVTNTPEWRMYP